MRYMLLCYDDKQAWAAAGPTALQEAMDEAVQLANELHAKGEYRLAAPLQPPATTTRVSVRDGKRQVTDGPFTETREVLGGFYIIDVNDVDEAIQIAMRHPGVSRGSVEIRPILEIPGLPAME